MQHSEEINIEKIQTIMHKHKDQLKIALKVCAHCTLCAESCFLFMSHNQDPEYMPSHKFINSIGVLYRKKGNVSRSQLEKMKDILWNKCALCTRCYCPMGIDIPYMISVGRSICRSQNILPTFEN